MAASLCSSPDNFEGYLANSLKTGFLMKVTLDVTSEVCFLFVTVQSLYTTLFGSIGMDCK